MNLHLGDAGCKRRIVFCLSLGLPLVAFTLALHVYLGSHVNLTISSFEVTRRRDARWTLQRGNLQQFSSDGSSMRTGMLYQIGPFEVHHWRANKKQRP